MTAMLDIGPDGLARCRWCLSEPLYVAYHDTEWGRPLHGDDALFELLVLEGMQAGLSWITILRKREGFRAAFARFSIATVAAFDADDVERLVADPAIVRHRGKITASIGNARACLALAGAGTSLDALCWSFAPPPRIRRLRPGVDSVDATTPESTALSKALVKAGFRFVGPTTVYAFMQAAGLVDDHLDGCEFAP